MGILDRFWNRAGGDAHRADGARLAAAIDKVVQGTDPRIKLAKGYRRRLEPAVARALEHAADVARSLPAALDLAPARWASEPVLRAMFARAEDIPGLISTSPSLREYARQNAHSGVDPVYCILTATLRERTVLAHALEGEILRADVAQRTVAFAEPRIVAGAASEEEFRRALEDWCLEQMVLAALERIAGMRARRERLQAQRELLRARLRMLQRAGAGLGGVLASQEAPAEDAEHLREQLERNDRALEEAGAGIRTLDAYLERVAEVLAHPEQVVSRREVNLTLDAMNVVGAPGAAGTVDLAFGEFAVTHPEPRRRVALLVRVARRDVPSSGPSLEAAMKLLG